MVLIGGWLIARTRFFRQFYFIGGNPRAAQLSGIRVDRLTLIGFVIMGALAGLAGVLGAARLNSAVVNAGIGIELKVITATVLGGASLKGGEGTILGGVLGVLFIALIENAMIINAIGVFWQGLVVGSGAAVRRLARSFQDQRPRLISGSDGRRHSDNRMTCRNWDYKKHQEETDMKSIVRTILSGAALAATALLYTFPASAQESSFGPADAKETYYWVSNKANLPLFVQYDYVGMKRIADELGVQGHRRRADRLRRAGLHRRRRPGLRAEAERRLGRRRLGSVADRIRQEVHGARRADRRR